RTALRARVGSVVLTPEGAKVTARIPLSDRVAFINQGSILTIDTPDNLKLEYGQRSVRVRRQSGTDVVEEVIPLDDASSADQIREAVSIEGLMTIHTEEATLEDIFVEFAGRGLGG
ncbi:MAG: hypothetical protein ABFR53_11535, partial [Actinomycetota bacterium]